MAYYVGLDVSLKTTAICVVDRDQNIVWQGSADTHPEMILNALDRWIGSIVRIGLETGSSSPWLARALKARNLPVIVMDARRAAAALKARPVKTDRADARALAEMPQSGWYTEVFVKSEESHRMKALLSARDQLVRNKRTFFGQIRGMLRPFGIRLPARQGTRKFDEAARAACRHDDLLYACVNALLEALGAIEAQITALDKRVRAMVQTSKACWYLTSVPCVSRAAPRRVRPINGHGDPSRPSLVSTASSKPSRTDQIPIAAQSPAGSLNPASMRSRGTARARVF